MIGILKYCFLHVREVQQTFRVWVGDDRDIKVLFYSDLFVLTCSVIFKTN